MRPRIVFVVMSAVHSAAAIDQLARSLAPHTVLVHHDFQQTPEFRLEAPNVAFVAEPKRTGWACWGFSEGIFHSLKYALEHLEFDYLQLLSPSCLPIKPLHRFESHVASGRADANFDSIDILEDRDALMSVGYRAFSPEHSLRHRILRRLSRRYFPEEGLSDLRHIAGVELRTGVATNTWGQMTLVAHIALWVMQATSDRRIGRHIFDDRFRVHFGSVWFGARREVVAAMTALYNQPAIQDYFRRLRIADEFLVPTLLRAASMRKGPCNHMINAFDGARPQSFDDSDFDRLRESPAFFARKFRDDPEDATRRRVLDELVATPGPFRARTRPALA